MLVGVAARIPDDDVAVAELENVDPGMRVFAGAAAALMLVDVAAGDAVVVELKDIDELEDIDPGMFVIGVSDGCAAYDGDIGVVALVAVLPLVMPVPGCPVTCAVAGAAMPMQRSSTNRGACAIGSTLLAMTLFQRRPPLLVPRSSEGGEIDRSVAVQCPLDRPAAADI